MFERILNITAWKVFVFEVFLVLIFSHLDWIRTRKTPNTDTSRSVNLYYIYNVSIRSLVMEKIIAEILSKLRKMIFSVNCFRGDFWDFLAPLTKFSFWGTSWELCLNCKHFRNFPENFLFLKIPRLKTIGNLWDNSYIYSILIVI